MKTLKDGCYVVINLYKFTVLKIWRDFVVLSYCMSVLSLHIESTNSMICVELLLHQNVLHPRLPPPQNVSSPSAKGTMRPRCEHDKLTTRTFYDFRNYFSYSYITCTSKM